MCIYVAVCNSINIGYVVLKVRFGFTDEQAGLLFTMPFIVSAIIAVPMGLFLDKYGSQRMTFAIIGTSSLVLSHIIQPLIPNAPDCTQCWETRVPLFLQGISFTTYCVVVYANIAIFIPERSWGTAFGINCSLYNIATVFSPPLEGYIILSSKSLNDGYFFVEIYFLILSLFALSADIYILSLIKKEEKEEKEENEVNQ